MEIVVSITPLPQARPRFTRQGHAYDTAKCKAYKRELALAAMTKMRGKPLYTCPIALSLTFGMPMPKSWSKKRRQTVLNACHDKKPDLDNLIKAVMDALSGIVWCDDKQISSIMSNKKYTDEPFIYINISELEGNDG